MPRTPTTSDVFSAIAEPRRREIIECLSSRDSMSVSELVDALNLSQPSVSKHLAVLLDVGAVSVERIGKSRLYKLNPQSLKPLHDWTSQFEKMWSHQLLRIKHRAERLAAQRARKN